MDATAIKSYFHVFEAHIIDMIHSRDNPFGSLAQMTCSAGVEKSTSNFVAVSMYEPKRYSLEYLQKRIGEFVV